MYVSLEDLENFELEETRAISEYLSRLVNEHITPIALRIAYCQGVHSLTEPDEFSDRIGIALSGLRDSLQPNRFNTGGIFSSITKLVAIDMAVLIALNLVDEAPSNHRGYQRIGQGLHEVRHMIRTARTAADEAVESQE